MTSLCLHRISHQERGSVKLTCNSSPSTFHKAWE